jgi:hypothetical protein
MPTTDREERFMTRWFPRRKRRPDPDAPAAPGPAPGSSGTTAAPAGTAWPDICGQFSMHLLALAEQLRISLDALESDEDDPERLRRLYAVDHAVTRMRRASLDLRTLAGRGEDALTAPVTSLLDVIRMALSGIERYAEVTVARVADLAVLGYAADDLAELLAALLDNATRYSPGGAAVSAHLAADGSVLLRVEDSGIGMAPEAAAQVNETLAGPVRDIDSRAGLHTGFPVVHRIASRHQIAVRLASRPGPASGTVAMVTLPARLLCEIPPAPAAGVPAAGAGAGTAAEGVTPLAAAARRARVPPWCWRRRSMTRWRAPSPRRGLGTRCCCRRRRPATMPLPTLRSAGFVFEIWFTTI